jgi:hypothetical protein
MHGSLPATHLPGCCCSCFCEGLQAGPRAVCGARSAAAPTCSPRRMRSSSSLRGSGQPIQRLEACWITTHALQPSSRRTQRRGFGSEPMGDLLHTAPEPTGYIPGLKRGPNHSLEPLLHLFEPLLLRLHLLLRGRNKGRQSDAPLHAFAEVPQLPRRGAPPRVHCGWCVCVCSVFCVCACACACAAQPARPRSTPPARSRGTPGCGTCPGTTRTTRSARPASYTAVGGWNRD